MKLVELKVSNFMSIGDINLQLDRVGMNLILGRNVDDPRFDSNGSAKSALFEAMTWGLFGEFLRDISAESVIRVGTDKVTVSVLVDPEDGTDRVWFTRTRTKKEHAISVTTEKGDALFPANSVKDIQPQINSWLGLDFRTFTNSVYFGKGLVKFFMASNDNERKDLLETILQLVSFDDALDRAKGLAKKCSEDIVGHNTEIAIAKALNNEKNTTLSSLIGKLQEAKHKLRTEQPVLLEKRVRLETDKQKITDSLIRVDALIAKEKIAYDAEYDRLNKQHVAHTEAMDTNLAFAVAGVVDTFDRALTILKDEHQKVIDSIAAEYKELSLIHDHLTEKNIAIGEEVAGLRGVIKSVTAARSHISGLTEELPCKECFQNISIDHKASLIKKYNDELEPLHNQVTNLISQSSNISQEIVLRYTRPVKDLEERHNKILELNNTIIIGKQEEKRRTIDNIQHQHIQDKVKLSQEFVVATKKLQEDHHKKVNDWVKDSAGREISIKNLETQIAEITRTSDELDTNYDRLNSQVEDIKKDITRIIKSKKFAEEKIEATEAVKAKTDFWVEGFGPRGIKSFVFEAALPYLTARTNHYSSFLTGGTVTIDITPLSVVKSTGNVKEKLNVSAVNSIGANVYNGNSDGERRRIDICVLLALQDLISTRASKTWSTFIFDEIFDCLDKTGIEHVVDMFRTFKGKSIYIISHSSDIKKHFDTAITVVKKDGVSSLENMF